MSEESSPPSPQDAKQPVLAEAYRPTLDSGGDHPAEPGRAETSPDVAQPSAGKESAAPQDPDAGLSASLQSIRQALRDKTSVEGKVIGWNNGGFHVVTEDLTAFCPRSEMEIGQAKEPEIYLDQTFRFRPLRIQKKGRRIVLSRAAELKADRARSRAETRKKLVEGAILQGRVASLTDFGAFVDLGGGVQGLIHVSEISRERVGEPSEKLAVGQEVTVKIRKLEKSGKRISLSMRALEPDPWQGILKRYPRGSMVRGKVEKATDFGAFIELEPGLTGLLPASAMSIPRETTPARVYPPGKEVAVQIVSIDPRRQRISLAPEGSALEGSRVDYKDYIKSQQKGGPGTGFNALANALRKLQQPAD
jgi:small subunit ribosomal protein S1